MHPSRRRGLAAALAAAVLALGLAAAGASATYVTPQSTGFTARAVGNVTLAMEPGGHSIICTGLDLGDAVPYAYSNPNSSGSVISGINPEPGVQSTGLRGCLLDGVSPISGGAEGVWSFSWNTIATIPTPTRIAALAVPVAAVHFYDANCTMISDVAQSVSGTWTNGPPVARVRFEEQALLVSTTNPCPYGAVEELLFSGSFEVTTTLSGTVAVN